jgi:anti-anti-sigma factor
MPPVVLPSQTSSGNRVLIRIEGSLGIGEADRLQAYLQKFSAQRPSVVLLDLAAVPLVSALVLGVMVEFRRGLVRAGCHLYLTAIHPGALEAIRRTGLENHFPLLPENDDSSSV